jgi:cell division protein FtsQ
MIKEAPVILPVTQFTPSPSLQPVYKTAASKEQIEQRRRHLRKQRRIRVVQSLWRFVCMSGMLAGLVWAINQPDWTISKPEQIRIEGNQYLSETAIRSMLSISYPKPIVELAPDRMATQLTSHGSIARVKIDRGLLPPHLRIQIEDLPPVAGVMPEQNTRSQIYLDERGRQVPISSYLPPVARSLPTLRVRLSAQGICPNWMHIYQAIHTSPVSIGIVDCRNPQNLILQTEVGKVRLGATGDRSRLNSQIQQLDLLRDWKKHADGADVDYLDLENPESAKLQLK